jgi:hypothetical protein
LSGRAIRFKDESELLRRRAPSALAAVEPLEREVQRACREALRAHPAVSRVFRMNSGAHVIDDGQGARRFIRYHDVDGLSDLWVWLKRPFAPRQAFIEVKRPGEKPTEKQAAFLEGARAYGHIAFWCTDAAQCWAELTKAVEGIWWPII